MLIGWNWSRALFDQYGWGEFCRQKFTKDWLRLCPLDGLSDQWHATSKMVNNTILDIFITIYVLCRRLDDGSGRRFSQQTCCPVTALLLRSIKNSLNNWNSFLTHFVFLVAGCIKVALLSSNRLFMGSWWWNTIHFGCLTAWHHFHPMASLSLLLWAKNSLFDHPSQMPIQLSCSFVRNVLRYSESFENFFSKVMHFLST